MIRATSLKSNKVPSWGDSRGAKGWLLSAEVEAQRVCYGSGWSPSGVTEVIMISFGIIWWGPLPSEASASMDIYLDKRSTSNYQHTYHHTIILDEPEVEPPTSSSARAAELLAAVTFS